jgi:hypothetical protein
MQKKKNHWCINKKEFIYKLNCILFLISINMESYSSHQQHRPLTPPNERKAHQETQLPYLEDKTSTQLPPVEEKTSLSDIPYLEKAPAFNTLPPVSTAPSAPPTTAASVNPFISNQESKLSDTPISNNRGTFGQRNETTRRIENEVVTILKWKNPVRSALIFALTVGSILLTRWYSLLQIGASAMCIATGINLLYVTFILQSRKVVASQETSHPYK